MATHRDPAKLAAVQRARALAMRTRLRVEHYKMCQELYDEAKSMLGGRTSVRDLIAMGHPYGRRAGTGGAPGRQRRIKGTKGMMPALPINAQKGRLRDALHIRGAHQGQKQVYVLKVDKASVPYARYILSPNGTRRMVTRPFWATLYKRWRKRNFELLVAMRERQRHGP